MSTVTCELRVKTLAARLSAALVLTGMGTHAFAAVLPVTSCADDNSVGTLRQVAASALSGDQIDLSQLSCTNNKITLTQGEVVIAHNASIVGSASAVLTIANGGSGRLLNSTSTDAPSAYLNVTNVNVSGGGVYASSSDALGGCILATGAVALTASTVSGCVASSNAGSGRGGAIYAQSVSLTSSKVLSSNAYAGGTYQVSRGGGVYAQSLTCTDSTLSGNAATASGAWWFEQGGGGFVGGGSADLVRCTVDTNQAGAGGGIIQFAFSGGSSHTTIQNSTISGNSALGGAGGFQLSCPDCTPQAMQIMNSTVAFNTSGTGYAALDTAGTAVAQSSIVAKNLNGGGAADLSSTTVTGANNLVMSTDSSYGGGVITFTTDPQLSALTNNGGVTRTHLVPATSPAYNHGNNSSGYTTDQRGAGFVRTLNGLTDIGAYQHQSTGARH